MKKINFKTVIQLVTIISIFILFLTGIFSKDALAENEKIEKTNPKWDITIKSENIDFTAVETHNINFKVEDNPYVVKNKMAPGCKAVANLEINLEGTETSVELNIEVDKSKLPSDNFKVTAKMDGEILNDKKLIELEDNQAFTAENGIKEITIELIWEINEEDENNTFIGMNCDILELPVTVSVEQHI